MSAKEPKRGVTRWVVVAAGLVLIMGCVSAYLIAQNSAAPEEPSTLKHRVTIPLEDGRLELGTLLGAVADQVGLDGEQVRASIDVGLSIHDPAGDVKLREVESAFGGVLTIERGSGELVLQFDRAALRQQEVRARRNLRGLVHGWFPDRAATAGAAYGVWFVQDDATLVEPTPELLGDTVVVLVHGLDDWGGIWLDTAPPLIKAGHRVCRFEYPNDQAIEDSTALFAEHLKRLRAIGVKRVNLVAHSMGGLISRDVLTDPRYYSGDAGGGDDYPRVDRLIMVGTPNHGSQMARLRAIAELRDQVGRLINGEARWLGSFFDGAGEAKIDLLPDSAFLRSLNARPNPPGVAMTIIAAQASPIGGDEAAELAAGLRSFFGVEDPAAADRLGDSVQGLVNGVGDGVVSLASTRLDGVDDHVVVSGNHLSMVCNAMSLSDDEPPAVAIIRDRLAEPAP